VPDVLRIRLPLAEHGELADLAIDERRSLVAQAEILLIDLLRRRRRKRREADKRTATSLDQAEGAEKSSVNGSRPGLVGVPVSTGRSSLT
jgi:hypothetical protein